jgi:hypothetical protein
MGGHDEDIEVFWGCCKRGGDGWRTLVRALMEIISEPPPAEHLESTPHQNKTSLLLARTKQSSAFDSIVDELDTYICGTPVRLEQATVS